jgi:hypothetical protein
MPPTTRSMHTKITSTWLPVETHWSSTQIITLNHPEHCMEIQSKYFNRTIGQPLNNPKNLLTCTIKYITSLMKSTRYVHSLTISLMRRNNRLKSLWTINLKHRHPKMQIMKHLKSSSPKIKRMAINLNWIRNFKSS